MTVCDVCANECKKTGIGTGYGKDADGNHVCYQCCADIDRNAMLTDGKCRLYLDQSADRWSVSNWPGTLRYNVISRSTGRHNIARKRYDVWFRGPGGYIWHGTQYGDWTQITHCKRTSRKQL